MLKERPRAGLRMAPFRRPPRGHRRARPKRYDGRTPARDRPPDRRNHLNRRRRFKPNRMQWLAIAVPAAATIIGAVIVVVFAR